MVIASPGPQAPARNHGAALAPLQIGNKHTKSRSASKPAPRGLNLLHPDDQQRRPPIAGEQVGHESPRSAVLHASPREDNDSARAPPSTLLTTAKRERTLREDIIPRGLPPTKRARQRAVTFRRIFGACGARIARGDKIGVAPPSNSQPQRGQGPARARPLRLVGRKYKGISCLPASRT